MKFKMKFSAFFSVLFRLVAWTRFGAIFISNWRWGNRANQFSQHIFRWNYLRATQIQRESLTVMEKAFSRSSANRNPFVALMKPAIVLRPRGVPRSIKGNKTSISRFSLRRKKNTLWWKRKSPLSPCLAARV
jgi:hypothetical protein